MVGYQPGCRQGIQPHWKTWVHSEQRAEGARWTRWPPTNCRVLGTRGPKDRKGQSLQSFKDEPAARMELSCLLKLRNVGNQRKCRSLLLVLQTAFPTMEGSRWNLSTYPPHLMNPPAGYVPLLGDTPELTAAVTCGHSLWSPLLPPAGGKLKGETFWSKWLSLRPGCSEEGITFTIPAATESIPNLATAREWTVEIHWIIQPLE